MDQKLPLRSHAIAGRPVIDPAAWTGKALEANNSWIIELDHGALDDLKYLADQLRPKIKGNPNALLNFTKDDMPIGRFTGVLDCVRHMLVDGCLLYTSPSPRDRTRSRMPSSA